MTDLRTLAQAVVDASAAWLADPSRPELLRVYLDACQASGGMNTATAHAWLAAYAQGYARAMGDAAELVMMADNIRCPEEDRHQLADAFAAAAEKEHGG